MEEKITEMLAQYELTIYRASRVKGAYLLETDRGRKLFGGCRTSEGRLGFEQKLKQSVCEAGVAKADCYVRTREGALLVPGPYGEMFLMRDWFDGEECNVWKPEQVLLAVRTMARLHGCLVGVELTEQEEEFCRQQSLIEQLARRNRELRRVRTYIRGRKQKGAFESLYLSCFPALYAQAEQAAQSLDGAAYLACYEQAKAERRIAHGAYTHHSVLVLPDGGTAVINFEKAEVGLQIHDFYLFFRKIMEKHDWDAALGEQMLSAYGSVRPIPEPELELLIVLLRYPEKFWKIANQYGNSRKTWVPQRNVQKLALTMEQTERKRLCLKELFGDRAEQ